jgi:hypothetical protein
MAYGEDLSRYFAHELPNVTGDEGADVFDKKWRQARAEDIARRVERLEQKYPDPITQRKEEVTR